jgi:hypothetical protein
MVQIISELNGQDQTIQITIRSNGWSRSIKIEHENYYKYSHLISNVFCSSFSSLTNPFHPSSICNHYNIATIVISLNETLISTLTSSSSPIVIEWIGWMLLRNEKLFQSHLRFFNCFMRITRRLASFPLSFLTVKTLIIVLHFCMRWIQIFIIWWYLCWTLYLNWCCYHSSS